jgi:hypothetical protein
MHVGRQAEAHAHCFDLVLERLEAQQLRLELEPLALDDAAVRRELLLGLLHRVFELHETLLLGLRRRRNNNNKKARRQAMHRARQQIVRDCVRDSQRNETKHEKSPESKTSRARRPHTRKPEEKKKETARGNTYTHMHTETHTHTCTCTHEQSSTHARTQASKQRTETLTRWRAASTCRLCWALSSCSSARACASRSRSSTIRRSAMSSARESSRCCARDAARTASASRRSFFSLRKRDGKRLATRASGTVMEERESKRKSGEVLAAAAGEPVVQWWMRERG